MAITVSDGYCRPVIDWSPYYDWIVLLTPE